MFYHLLRIHTPPERLCGGIQLVQYRCVFLQVIYSGQHDVFVIDLFHLSLPGYLFKDTNFILKEEFLKTKGL
jgi:hypothetical protein